MMLPRTAPAHTLRAAALAVLVLTSGCSGGGDSTSDSYPDQQEKGARGASEALLAMREAAEAGDWETYVDRFYGEDHKFASKAQRDQVVARFRNEWGAQVLPVLQEASSLTPRIVGDRALFEKDGKLIFTLQKDLDGRWTFHL